MLFFSVSFLYHVYLYCWHVFPLNSLLLWNQDDDTNYKPGNLCFVLNPFVTWACKCIQLKSGIPVFFHGFPMLVIPYCVSYARVSFWCKIRRCHKLQVRFVILVSFWIMILLATVCLNGLYVNPVQVYHSCVFACVLYTRVSFCDQNQTMSQTLSHVCSSIWFTVFHVTAPKNHTTVCLSRLYVYRRFFGGLFV